MKLSIENKNNKTEGMIAADIKASELKKTYENNGCFFPIKVLEGNELKYFQDQYYEHEALLGDDSKNPNRFKQLHLHFPWAYELVNHPAILKCVTAILGENVLVHGGSVFCKSPKDNTFVSWHQDGYYMKLKSFEYVSVWFALSDANKENGCMRFIPESHAELLPHIEQPNALNLLGSGLTTENIVDETKAVDVELKAGEMSLHHVNLLHGSNPNKSTEKRVGFAIRYISTNFSQELSHHKVVLASGNYNESHFELLKSPPTGDLESCIKKQKIGHDFYAKTRQQLL